MTNFENNREWANSISETLEHSTTDSIMNYLSVLENKWSIPESPEQIFSSILQKFNISNIGNIDIAVIGTEYNKIIWETSGVHSKFKKLVEVNESLSVRWEKLFENIYYSERFLRTMYILKKTNTKDYNISMNEDPPWTF